MGYVDKVFSGRGRELGEKIIDLIPEVVDRENVYFMGELYFEMGAKLIDKYSDNKEVAEAMKMTFMLGLFAGVFNSDSAIGNMVRDIGEYIYKAYLAYLVKRVGESKK